MRATNTARNYLPALAGILLLGTACLADPITPPLDGAGGVGSFEGAAGFFTVGGTATGMPPAGLELSNIAETIVLRADGAYAFPTAMACGDHYHVEVVNQPPTLFCSVANYAGTIGSAPVQDVDVTCACAEGLADCDGNRANGCEQDVASDDQNCGACGVTCQGGERCQAGTCAVPAALYRPVGLQQSVPVATVTGGGWALCGQGRFGSSTSQAELFAACSKAKIMYACRPTGSQTLEWLAWTSRNLAFNSDAWNVESNGASWTSSFGDYMQAEDGTHSIWWAYSEKAPYQLNDGGCGLQDYWDDTYEFVLFQAD